MDVFEMLDSLEEMVETCPKIPLTSKAIVNAEELLEYLDQIRSILPEEIRQARWIAKERERLLLEAQHEASRIVEEARSQINKLAEETEVVKKAKERAEELINRARQIGAEIKTGSEAYADEVLSKLEENISKSLEIIRQSRDELQHFKQQNAS
ncbi:ATPase [Zhaonella formicivorans]|jgi:cell division septum initiation protein DivIVA|uniref:ATPase n=1 Tax=Zhaonella formicivorans TaxID=2528593 RepID=UPI0010D7591A|nr:ATPase [Zhaonella formicivorans]